MRKLFYVIVLLCSTTIVLGQKTNYEVRYASHPDDVKHYDTQTLRKHFAIEKLFADDEVNIVYTMFDRFVIGGAMPVNKALQLEAIDPLKAPNFLHRREIGILNIGGAGSVSVGNDTYKLGYKEVLYVGCGDHEIVFRSDDASKPALFYFNSATAHKAYPTKKITKEDAVKIEAGSLKESNARTIIKYIVNETTQTCQLQLGMTELKEGSVWNTMPAHTHGRRMEAYFYFNLPEDQSILHVMGEPTESRNIWLHNQQAVISPEWSIHTGAGTTNYDFVWGMAGENLDYTDMDKFGPAQLK